MKRLGMPAKGLQPVNLKGLGSQGLNTQTESSTLGPQWLVEADNVVFDFQGKISARKGRKQTAQTVALSIMLRPVLIFTNLIVI